jgi:hypothetical protein
MTKAISQLVDVPTSTQAIRTLQANDIYKRLDSSSYGPAKITIGIVTSVLANGDGDMAVVAIEFVQGYQTTTAEQKVFKADETVALFPITVEEFNMNVDDLRQGARDALRKAQEQVTKQAGVLEFIEKIQYGTFGVQPAEQGPVDGDADGSDD